MSEREEKKNQRIGLLTSVGIHFAMLLLFLFAMGWKAPNPPLSEYGSGIELNFGTDDQGSGDVQSFDPGGTTAEKNTAEEKAATKEQKQETQQQKAELKNDAAKEEKTLTSKDEESPEVIKETKKDAKKEAPKEPVEPKKKVTETKKEVAAKDSKETSTKKDIDGTKKSTSTGGTNEGDDKDKTGNKGKAEGTLDPNGQYTGKPGTGGGGEGGGGFGLNMNGWDWDKAPQAPKLPDNDNGKIEFEIEVDAEGEITAIRTITRGLSPEAEKICKQEIQKRSFVRTASSAAPEKSTGRITFILKTK